MSEALLANLTKKLERLTNKSSSHGTPAKADKRTANTIIFNSLWTDRIPKHCCTPLRTKIEEVLRPED